MAQPTVTPTWATDPTAQISQPLSAKSATGWVVGEKPFATHMNWLFNIICAWITYLKNLTSEALTWNARQSFNGGASCPTPLQANDVANKQYVDGRAGSGGLTWQTYDTNDPAWAFSAQNPLLFSKDANNRVAFIGETLPTMSNPGTEMGWMPIGYRPLKTVLVTASMYPQVVCVTVQPNGYMYLDSVAPVSGRPVVFDGGGYIAGQ